MHPSRCRQWSQDKYDIVAISWVHLFQWAFHSLVFREARGGKKSHFQLSGSWFGQGTGWTPTMSNAAPEPPAGPLPERCLPTTEDRPPTTEAPPPLRSVHTSNFS